MYNLSIFNDSLQNESSTTEVSLFSLSLFSHILNANLVPCFVLTLQSIFHFRRSISIPSPVFPFFFSHPPSFHLTSQSFSVSIEEGNPQGVYVPSLCLLVSVIMKSRECWVDGPRKGKRSHSASLFNYLFLPRKDTLAHSWCMMITERSQLVVSQSYSSLVTDLFLESSSFSYRCKCVPSVIGFSLTPRVLFPPFPSISHFDSTNNEIIHNRSRLSHLSTIFHLKTFRVGMEWEGDGDNPSVDHIFNAFQMSHHHLHPQWKFTHLLLFLLNLTVVLGNFVVIFVVLFDRKLRVVTTNKVSLFSYCRCMWSWSHLCNDWFAVTFRKCPNFAMSVKFGSLVRDKSSRGLSYAWLVRNISLPLLKWIRPQRPSFDLWKHSSHFGILLLLS